MKLIRLLIGLALIAGVVYVAVEVPLGEKTLVQHVRAIAGTEEGQELVEGVKQKAVEVKDRATGVKEEAAGDGGGGEAGVGDDLTDKERKLLRKLIKDKLKDAAKAESVSKAPPKK
jgi:hypothetical protein